MLVLASASPRRRELLTQAGFTFEVHPAHIPEDPQPNEDPIAYVVRLARQKAQAVYDQIASGDAGLKERDFSRVGSDLEGLGGIEGEHPAGAKAQLLSEDFAARLKSCPVTKPAGIGIAEPSEGPVTEPSGVPVLESSGNIAASSLAAAGLGSEGTLTVLGADTTVVLDGQILGKPEDAADAARMLRLLSGRTHRVITGVAVVTAACTEVAAEVTAVKFLAISDEEIAAYIATGEPMDKAGAYAIQGRAARWIPRIEGDYFNVVGLPIALVSTLLGSF